MPSMADISSFKADDTTAIVYTGLTPASGDGAKAQWRDNTVATAVPVGHRATMSMSTVWNNSKTARRSVIEYRKPYTVLNSTTGRYETTDACVGRLEFTTPVAIPAAEINEAVYQFFNALGASSGDLLKLAVSQGYAPT